MAMRLISIAVLVTYLAVKVNGQKFQHEHYPFPPQFPTPSSAVYTSDNTLYLPPDSHSPLPYFPLKNVNLPYQYLPPTGTKAPGLYPTPFPIILSSHSVPSFDDEDDDDDEAVNRNKIHLSSPLPPPRPFYNRTQNVPPPQNQYQPKETRTLPQTVSYRQPIDRADAKLQIQLGTFPTPTNQTPPTRRMIISSENARNDQFQDQLKSPSNYQGIQFLPPPGFVSSTTEPAIPILRLSNEMDLDGSFSYEALGADQTHYVQHSRMENMGTEKEEQVVEGSYSYVGDNGQTYTVHYVADSNGFRASGDHLPVAPPVPEIIQRAVQYNLAEEAKRPPHLKNSWEDESKAHDSNERLNHFGSLPPPPPRSLFTGKTPEAFSYSYGSGSSYQSNVAPYQESSGQSSSQNGNLVTSASNLAPVKTVNFGKEQVKPQEKPTSGPITPQITFLASQGAHVPSINSPQQSISRMFTNTEKSMPQLMNYEAILKESEPEDSKPLWRWQYGQNVNNIVPTKSSISRSSGDGDDVMINFNEMTQEQYTNMIQSQLEPVKEGQGMESQSKPLNYPYKQISQQSQIPFFAEHSTTISQVLPTEIPVSTGVPYAKNWYNDNMNSKNIVQPHVPLEQRNVPPTYPNLSFLQQQPETQQSYMEKHNAYHHHQQESQKPHMSEQNIPQVDPKQHATLQNFQKEPQIYNTKEQNIEHKVNQLHTTEKTLPKTKTTSSDDWFNHENYAQSPGHQETMKTAESYEMPAHSRSNLITQKKFIPQSQTVTQSYDYEDNDDVESMFEVRKIKSLNAVPQNEINVVKQDNIPTMSYITTSTDNNLWKEDAKEDIEIRIESSPKPLPAPTFSNAFKFTDFIVKDESSNFKPITTTKQPFDVEREITTSTTESMEDIFTNNIFLKNLIRSDKTEQKNQNSIREEEHKNIAVHKTAIPESKSDKIPKIMNYPNDLPIIRKKPLDISEVLNYVSHKNSFDIGKTKPKSKSIHPDFNHKKEINYYSNGQDDTREENEHPNYRKPLNHQQQEEMRGIIKNYKVLQRNNHNNHNNHNMNVESNPIRKDQNSMPLRMLQMQQPNLPPLGRAGPTVKAYLPPIYV